VSGGKINEPIFKSFMVLVNFTKTDLFPTKDRRLALDNNGPR